MNTLHLHIADFKSLGVCQMFLDGMSKSDSQSAGFIYLTAVFLDAESAQSNWSPLGRRLNTIFDDHVDIVVTSDHGERLPPLHAEAREVFSSFEHR